MKKIRKVLCNFSNQPVYKCWIVGTLMILSQASAFGQTFEFPFSEFADTVSLKTVMLTATGPCDDTVLAEYDAFLDLTSATQGTGYTLKSVTALVKFMVDVQSLKVGKHREFTYMITYQTKGWKYDSDPNPAVSILDTLSISYDGDSLKLINDRTFKIIGSYSKLRVVICDVFEITNNNGVPNYNQLTQGVHTDVPEFVYIVGEVHVQKYMTPSSMNMGSIVATNDITYNGTVLLDWGAAMSAITPAGYEVEWTYVPPYGPQDYEFRNNSTRVFTNKTSYRIPVAEKEGTLVYRVRMVRPELTDLLSRKYGAWSVTSDQGSLSSVSGSSVQVQQSHHDSLNWDLKMSFVEDGKYKQVMTYYDGLLKNRQVQTRFNSNPSQTIIAQSLYDHEGRAVITSLPIPVDSVSRFSYLSNFLRPANFPEYTKLMYDAIPDTNDCPPREYPVNRLDANAKSNLYFSINNPDTAGKNAFIPDAEGYPFVRKILAAENNEKVLFEGQAGPALQLGNGRHTAYMYGSPIQAELNRYFGQDVGKYNYYRKMITTDNHGQEMFSITDDEGRIVASGLIGSPDTTELALSIRNLPDTGFFHSSLLPVPNIRVDEHWRNNGSYFIESKNVNYEFKYQIDYDPYKPCPDTPIGLSPKVYYAYEVIDPCGDTVLQDEGTLGEPGLATGLLNHAAYRSKYLTQKGNYTWKKYSYIKIEDLRASVDAYLAGGYFQCFLTLDSFLKKEFVESTDFPCQSSYDPCSSLRQSMMKEMYPLAKYGQYQYTDSSKVFAGPGTNSIFSLYGTTYRYQDTCLPDYVDFGDTTYYIKDLQPAQLIPIFNDSIAAALLPLHPEYCKLQLCPILRNPYCKQLATVKKASEAVRINRYEIGAIAGADPVWTNSPPFLTIEELTYTMVDSLPIDSLAFIKTICGSESGVIESVCRDINMGKTPVDISDYPDYVHDEYYRNLVSMYTTNRENRLSKYLQESGSSCGPCSLIRLDDSSSSLDLGPESDTTFLVGGMDSLADSLHLPVSGSFGRYFESGSGFNKDSLDAYTNADNSKYCTELIGYITHTLAGCDVSQDTLTALQDTLKNRFCTKNHSITTLTYDSLSSIMAQVGIATDDLCNSGLVDLRRITRKSNDHIQLGLLHRPPAYYEDLSGFLYSKGVLDFIAGSADTMIISLMLCDDYPFQQRLAGQLGTGSSSNCADTQNVLLVKTIIDTPANAVKLAFIDNSVEVNYYLYPVNSAERNGLNAGFNAQVITGTDNYEMSSLFNLYGFDKVSGSYANRNTAILRFDGQQAGDSKRFSYFLSAFTVQDHNLMEADEQEYLNGIGCSEFIPMAREAVTMAEALDIKFGHPYFEQFFTNVVNYRNSVNFDFNNYNTALVSCGVSDSIIIPKHIAHFRIKFQSSNDIGPFIDTLRKHDTTGVGISDILAHDLNGNYLLLNVHEANERNIKETKQIVEALVPVGSIVEYLPFQHKDTLAQLFVYNFEAGDPMQFRNTLSNAFPGAEIYPGSMDPHTDVNVQHFIPGHTVPQLHAYCYTIVHNLDTPYYYNHYVDSIYKFLAVNAPMTTVFTHAEPGVSAQYNDMQMEAWRNYTRSLPGDDHYLNVKGSKANKIKTEVPSFSGSALSYKNTKSPYYLNNLYIDGNASNTNYTYIANLLNGLQSINGTILKTYAHNQPHFGTGNTETRAYVCGDTTQFWINHFDANRRMINIFIKLPGYLPMTRDKYALLSVSKGMEKDSATYINLVLHGYDPVTGIRDTIRCIGYTNRNLGEIYTIPSAYLSTHSRFESLSGKFENCETRRIQELIPNAQILYNLYVDSMRNVLVSEFRQDVIDNLQEQLTIKGNDIKHGITLYYYDVAGNKIMTVPPAGVGEKNVTHIDSNTIIDNARAALYGGGIVLGSIKVPTHTKTTRTTYNAQNKPRTINTPDATGVTEICYDLAGRIVMTQDAKQRAAGICTYFIYDNLSRVVETGSVIKNNDWKQEKLGDPAYTFSSMVKGLTRYEVRATMYDTPSYQVAGPFATLPTQENLKNRIACVKYYELINPNANAVADTNYVNALHYSYDVSGNIKTLIHDLRNVSDKLLRFKRVDYEYDLYSGKVILVSYNRGYADQFYQKYSYDSDNRITETNTSNNGIFWDRDAHYEYYEHGPLARTELGEQRVQGVDYAYTINGWLKAINGIQNDTANDMGMDGVSGLAMPKDVFSQRIDYFAGDYQSIGDTDFIWQLPATQKDLYNGNIAAIATALAPFDNLNKVYHYDPLQRIDRARYEEYTINNSGTPSYTKTPLLAWASEYKYDPDGNLLELKRMGGDVPPSVTTHLMDSLIYQYTDGTNKLKNLADLASTNQYKIDIQATPLDTGTRYLYDANGNLVKDIVSGLDVIDWNHAGKVKHIKKQDGSRLYFSYDPLGNRLNKEVVQYPAADSMVKFKTTYIRDAAGNILAIYEDKKEYDLSKLIIDVVRADRWLGHGGGPIDAPLGKAIADRLYTAYITDSGDNLARRSMAIPDINAYVNNGALLQSMVSTMESLLALDFVKSIPEITEHTLLPPGETPVAHEKLSAYLQPLLLSEDLENLQTDLFVTLKTHNEMLYNSTVSTVPATTQEKMDFPGDPAMLQAFRGMEPGDKLSLTNTLAQALTTTDITTLEPVVNMLSSSVYNSSNSYSNFVQELSNGETILDGIRQDGASYIAYRYAQADLEEVPLETVKDEFRYNSVLSDIITQESNEPEPEALAVILNDNFADVVDLADNTGQGDLLVTSIRDALTVNVPLTDAAKANDWLRNGEILQSQRQHLAEHHIYGSSRVGIQKYLPEEAQYHFKSLGQGGTTNTLSTTRPWYTLYGNDLFKPTVYSNALVPANMGTDGMGINSHVLGMRQYELTNHLGNVQATVLDRTTPILKQTDSSLLGYSADISLAHDYYPFGMLMPGRYVSDTDQKCVTINTSILVPVVVKVYLDGVLATGYKYGDPNTPAVHNLPVALLAADEQPYVYHYNDASTHPNGEVVSAQLVEGHSEFGISLSEEPSGGVTAYFMIHADTNQSEQEIGFDLTLPDDCYMRMRVRQYAGTGEEYDEVVSWTNVDMSGAQQLMVPMDKAAIAAGGKTVLELEFNSAMGGNFPANQNNPDVFARNFYYKITHYEPKTRIAIVCDEKDSYRFSYNGIEKVNEVAGIGNHLTALYGEYSTRLGSGGRWNRDPKPIASESPYAMFRGNPIWYVDPLLDYSRAGAWWRNIANGGNGISKTESTGEWGYEKNIKNGVAFRDGLSKSERQGRIAEYKKSHTYIKDVGWIETGTMRAYEPDVWAQWGSSESFIGKTSYDLANGLYQLPQLATQSFNGGFHNIDGTLAVRGSKEHLGSFYNGAMFFMQAGEASVGLAYLKKVNAAQFSHIFKGTTISSASPAVRGTLNRGLNNYLIPRWNNYVPTGSFIFDGIDIVDYAKQEQENK